ncbi:glutamate-1-semialdehyde 2,1-aminomutase [Microbispora rosea subsp. aerata]|nr:aspartate aminotransferase family protein [Microbispora rosea]GGO22441.1 glutamate-1-semialdehyde 2,1-aminomutase [Microbispora rosea subsp. aerata]GIH57441.1 glutamate-1-semialdehyde 2,1-aminomutase [Microbispora rosea subsp. aerata]GLJ86392.1 glutamate-1-semialdehyde 2,1-aminomutase [Microbispora rosea subsp. aerata]
MTQATVNITAPATNDQLLDATMKVIAGGGSSNMRNLGIQTPLVLDRSGGCRIWDVEGNELVDVNMGYGPHLFGYADPDILGAVADQLRLGAVTGIPHRLDHEAGELIAATVPTIEQVRFAQSGSEAIASTLRLARFVTGRTLVVTFEGHYHGWSETVLRKAAITNNGEGSTRAVPGAPGMIPEALAHTLQIPWNDPEALDAVFREHGGEIAAVILEPICGNAGVVHPRPGFVERIADLTARHGALLVFDEVITGFRVALGGAQELLSVRPDLTILSKVLGGGFPVAAFGGSREMMEPLARNEAFHAGVFAGNHAAVGAVVATLRKLRANPSVYDTLETDCAYLERRLTEVFAAANRPVRIARCGSVMSVALLTKPQETDPRYDAAVSLIDFAAHRRLQLLCQDAGLYFHPNPLEPWFLSTAHTRDELDTVVQTIGEALARL